MFDSAREADRWAELRLLEKNGLVRELRRQVALLLHVRDILIGEYRADFVYQAKHGTEWVTTIEDVKGFDTSLSRWKRKHVKAQYGITVHIVK